MSSCLHVYVSSCLHVYMSSSLHGYYNSASPKLKRVGYRLSLHCVASSKLLVQGCIHGALPGLIPGYSLQTLRNKEDKPDGKNKE